MELIAGNEVWWKTGLEGSAVTVGRERVVLVQRDGRSGFGVGRFVVKIERAFGWIASAWADFFSEERGFSRESQAEVVINERRCGGIERGGVCSARIAHSRSEALVQRREHITLDESGERVG